MSTFSSQILPTLDAFGFWSYWIIGLSSLLEGWWLTSVIVPGTLVVDAGGALVRLGHMDFIDLAWFVGIGAILGGELSWHSGRWLGDRVRLPRSAAFARAQQLIRKRGGLALVIGRFFGPVAGFVPLAAALAGMERRRFVVWNIVSGLAYALGHVTIGYAAGDIMARLGPYLPRLLLPLALVAILALVTWAVIHHLRRGLPALRAWGRAIRGRLETWPPVLRFAARHPRAAAVVARRLDPERGLLTTAVAALLLYFCGVFVDGAFDLAFVPGTEALDQRIANLAHAFWTPGGLSLAAWATQAGHVPVAALVALGAVLGLALRGNRAAAFGLATAVVGNAVTVTLLKLAFGRARPSLAYILESSNSFPSGHAAISVALYGTLAMMLWRERIIGPTVAITAGVVMAAGLGFTRLYLVEHFLSDVLNGWVVGAIWMVIGFAVSETVRQGAGRDGRRHPVLSLTAAGTCFAAALMIAVHADPVLAPGAGKSTAVFANLPGAIAGNAFPLDVVTLAGDPLPPVSLVSTGLGVDGIAGRLADGGWIAAARPDVVSGLAALGQGITDRPLDAAMVLPAFLDTRPADATLHSPARDTVLRLWGAGHDGTGAPVVGWALETAEGADAPAPRPAEASALSLAGARGGRTLAVDATGKAVRLVEIPPAPVRQ
ncbi:phosphatase PAP2 family protein [Salipiger sp.]|uniref:bifunctional DedA family/phosphatase PAP2 family protein n=1 Tax=Salipiger sp. TaxID=2078585 RepID=UPI003A9849B7